MIVSGMMCNGVPNVSPRGGLLTIYGWSVRVTHVAQGTYLSSLGRELVAMSPLRLLRQKMIKTLEDYHPITSNPSFSTYDKATHKVDYSFRSTPKSLWCEENKGWGRSWMSNDCGMIGSPKDLHLRAWPHVEGVEASTIHAEPHQSFHHHLSKKFIVTSAIGQSTCTLSWSNHQVNLSFAPIVGPKIPLDFFFSPSCHSPELEQIPRTLGLTRVRLCLEK